LRRLIRPFGTRCTFILVVVLSLGCAFFLALQKVQPCDDAYITLRHVKNLVEHGRPAWNLGGEPVLGSTTPAFLLAVAVFSSVFDLVQLDWAALYLNAVFQFVIVVLTFLIVRDLTARTLPSVLVASLIGLNSVNVFVFSQGFENAMLVAALLGALYLLRQQHDTVSLVIASNAPLIRPEGILLTPIVWGYVLLSRRFKKRLLIAYLSIPLLWLAFSTTFYGSPIPHPIQAKKKFPLIYRPYSGAEINLAERLPRAFSGAAALWNGTAGSLLFTSSSHGRVKSSMSDWRKRIMLCGLPLMLLASLINRDGRIIYLLYPPLFILLYGWIGVTMVWYFPSFITFAIVLLFCGWARFIDSLSTALERLTGSWIRRLRIPQVLLLGLFLLFITANAYSLRPREDPNLQKCVVFAVSPYKPGWESQEYQRFDGYRRAAEYLNAYTKQRATALINEVGVFGY
jgi:hypothetical protein